MTTHTEIPTLFGRGTAVLKEHEDLRPLVARLREYAHALAFGRPSQAPDLDLLLDHFFGQLLAHFAAEESEGYFGTFIEDHPDLSVQVECLMGEHEEMVDAIERLRAFGKRTMNERDLGLNLLELIGKFETHEQKENLLMRAFLAMPPAAL